MKKIRTRFAPSPTGYMHIGNLRTALFSYLIAKHDGGDFILRIEDTDQNREVKGALDFIYAVLKDTNLQYDEGPDKPGNYGPYIQSERLPIYKEYADKLVDLGGAHYCFCSEEDIQRQRDEAEKAGTGFKFVDPCHNISVEEARKRIAAGEKYVVRQTIPAEGITSFDDAVHGHIEVENSTLDEQVLLKSDGFPTYNFANVIDDHLMEINCVIRGNEYISSTPKYNLIYKAFNWDIPMYVHCPPVMKSQTQKLSKRNGDASYNDLIEKGYISPAILNYLALLGWAPEDNEEIFTMEELIKRFKIERINASPAIFDQDKLGWMNGEYLKRMPLEEFHRMALPWYKQVLTREVDLWELSMLLQTRILFFAEITGYDKKVLAEGSETAEIVHVPSIIDFIENTLEFNPEIYRHKKMKTTPENSLEALYWVKEKMEAWEDYTDDEDMTQMFVDLAAEKGVKNGRVMWPARVALSNKQSTPGGCVEIAHILGKEESLRRIDQAIKDLEKTCAVQ